jgi:hypothetical protein
VLTSHDPRRALEEADLALGLREGRSVLLARAGLVSDGDLTELYR